MMRFSLTLLLAFITTITFAKVMITKDVPYKKESTSKYHKLDIYNTSDDILKKGVFVFIHGGSWKNGIKETYRFLGKNMARKGYVVVIINYRLYPEVKYQSMVNDCIDAINWVKENIGHYGGDSDKITIAGHSAGGHLSALVALNSSFENLKEVNPIKKVILIDPFGLDMVDYFTDYHNDYAKGLLPIFGTGTEAWKEASPIYHIKSTNNIPFLVLVGSKTFPVIIKESNQFRKILSDNKVLCSLQTIKGKKHIAMIGQLYFRKNKMYGLITQFTQSAQTESQGNNLKALE